MTNGLYEKLSLLDKNIRIAIAGAGDFGMEMVTQIEYIKNMQVSVICDLDVTKAEEAFLEAGIDSSCICFAETAYEANSLIEMNKRVVMQDSFEMSKTNIDAVCDVTGNPYFGAELAYRTIEQGKHMIVVNIESDVGVGAILKRLADKAGVVYTEADGDQPSLIKGMYDWCRCLGFEVITAGKWTAAYPEESLIKSGNRVSDGYFDGSKNQVEMCCVANMTGLVPDIRGMHKPMAVLDDIADIFALKESGGILSKKGIVDVINCLSPDGSMKVDEKLQGGVFVVASCDNPRFAYTLRCKNVIRSKDGLRALLYRPFHLVGLEAPISIMKAVLNNEATGAPLDTPIADVIAISKKDLAAGSLLDGIGSTTVRGEIDNAAAARNANLLPLCLAEGVTLKTNVPVNTPITRDMLVNDGQSFMWRLRMLQESVISL